MKFLVNRKLATRISIITTAIILTGMTLLWFVVSGNAASVVKNDITNQMTDAVESRAAIISDYVSSAEEYMTAFALGSEVQELLADPDDPALLQKVQKYTEDFAAVKGIFEGLYIATPDTHVLTHTSKSAVGITTRTGDSLQVFKDTILSQRQLTNLGIMKSPGTGSMILSMYYPIYKGETCIGYVGAGVYASRLMDVLLGLEIKGLPNSEYVFLNAETGVYLYHEDEALLNTETTDSGYLEIIQRVKADGSSQAGTYAYQDENGVDQLAVYKYMNERGWIFMVRDNVSEVYQAVGNVRMLVGVLCAAVAAAIILINLVILYQQGKELMAVESAIRHLGSLDLSADQELKPFYGRTDEIGLIAETTHEVCGRLRKTIDDVGRILGEMAEGNIAVDVTRNESYYIGDFKALSESLKTIRVKLMKLMRDISCVANEVGTGASHVSAEVETLSRGTREQSVSVDGLVSHVTELTARIKDSTQRCSSASELMDKANGYAAEADARMAQLTTATQNIDQASSQIGSIIKTIEDIASQTNILALNASVEAARAGAAGKGFSIVAGEVRSLASKSAEAVQDTSVLIDRSVQAVKSGTESTNQAVSAMRIVTDCIQSIKTLMGEISLASSRQAEMITSVGDGIRDISRVVQANSAAAEESAVISKELSNQANALNDLLKQFRISAR